MCGIVGYIGSKDAYPILINGLKRLEYRGYDSAGVALISEGFNVQKVKGKVVDLEVLGVSQSKAGTIGMGHTRWATHGEPNEINAHPHISFRGHFTLVHNGIIENYSSIRKHLLTRGIEFLGETDTEVLVNLIEHLYLEGDLTAEQAVQMACHKVSGAYGIVVACKNEPDQLIAARKGSPLVIGVGDGEYYLASDATPLIEHTNNVIYMNDDDVAIIRRDELVLRTLKSDKLQPKVTELDMSIGEIDKEGFDFFMLKEIFEQPRSIQDTFRGRVLSDLSGIQLGGLLEVLPRLYKAPRIIITACGTSWHAGLVGEYFFEEFARVPVEVEYSSEFRYRNPILNGQDIVIAISQSGETADTLAAIRLAKERGSTVLGICNVVGSSIPRETDAGVYTHAGPEIGVASTKAFTAQVTVLFMMAMLVGRNNGNLSQEKFEALIRELVNIPDKMRKVLEKEQDIMKLAEIYKDAPNALYLGRGVFFPVALEGALKLKEISYIHAEGYPAAEMKHGPIALVDENMPIVVVATKDQTIDKVTSNIQEIKARKGKVIAIVSEGDTEITAIADHTIEVPETFPEFSVLLGVVPLQLFAYHVAVLRGCDVDQPRNLAKSVTVE
ncbi:MAG: glutamine--fructose-6-phosphate transaminase (isomerizing) [Bacteroidetes bacterium]|nr:glutamine--fructose-6-phosphate transaminase (isomerizing) [Bacteroidota bacterium]MBT7466571.1 glutamine--fructose-6-phosphate transaminase (isomerizing) [Bacteroidota bacterium]